MTKLSFPCWVGIAALLVAAPAWGAEDAAATVAHAFRVEIDSDVDMEVQGQKQKLDADTELRYTWRQTGLERVLNFDSMKVKLQSNAMEMMDSFMSREKFTNTFQGKTDEVAVDQAPPALKSMLEDSFGAPLVKLQVDKEGKELKREVVAGPGASAIVENGMIANAMLFHGPFPQGRKQWESEMQISMGNGGFAKGTLTFVQTKGNNYKVSGELSNEFFQQPGVPVAIKNAHYVVTGDETFDPADNDWGSGKFNIDVAFDLAAEKETIGKAKGKMVVTFEKLAEKP